MKDNSKILIIFDENINMNSFRHKLSKLQTKTIHLFPITSNWRVINDIENLAESLFGVNTKIELLESANLINKEVDILRRKVSKWSADLGNYKLADKPLKDWLLLPKGEVSTWWFSQLSQKNTLKTNIFFRIAQLNSVDKIISSDSFVLCVFSVSDPSFSLAIEMLCKRHSITTFRILSIPPKQNSLKESAKYYLSQKGISYSIFWAVHFISICILRAIKTRLVMSSVKNRFKTFDNSILFISYFPAVDKESAKEGILKNKYAIPLQEKMADMKKKIIWIWIYVSIDGHSYNDALKLAKKFKKNGEANFILYEFMSLKVLLKTLFLWIRQISIYSKLKKLIPDQILYKDLSVPEATIFIKNLIADFSIGLKCILYFELYKEIFSYYSNVSHCIYYSEMHGWEKALNAAKRLIAPQVKSIGFQHGGISKNYFFYFHHPSEMIQKNKSTSLPLPDILACNGDIPLHLMKRCGYPNIRKVEAIRHLYLTDYLNKLDSHHKENIVLIAGSVNRDETKALISLFYEAFPKPKGFQVWLKGHPTLPVEDVLEELKIDKENFLYKIKHDSGNRLLEPVKIVIVGTSTLAIEALARGCKVISPIFSDSMLMSHLEGFEKFYIKVNNPQKLKEIVEKVIKSNTKEEDLSNILDFISKYWYLDKSLQGWEKILR